MKAYGIFPAFALHRDDERSRACVELVTSMVVEALRAGGDCSHFVMDWHDLEVSYEQPLYEDKAEPHILRLANKQVLIDFVKSCVDPDNSTRSTIRSLATCRAVTFGYDGQAFLCIRHEDDAPVSADNFLVKVEERSDYLTATDYVDGWVHQTADDQ